MNARVTTTTEVVASPAAGLSIPAGQAFILGATQKGPVDRAVKITGLADFMATFGDRAGGTDTYDMVELAFKEGLAQAYIVRLAGPAPVSATKAVGSLTVTATSPGAWGNSITAEWVNATKTLVVSGVSYPCADVATLQAVLSLDNAPVMVTGSAIPTSDVASGSLSGGTDDASNAVIATKLALFNSSLGDGAVAVAGETAAQAGAALATHCAANNRHGIIGAVKDSALSAALVELATLSDPTLNLVWPNGLAGSKSYSPVGAVLGARARAMATGNPQQSPIAPAYGTMRFLTGVATEITDAEWKTANAAGLTVLRGVTGQVRLAGWRNVAAPGGVKTLQGANYRDLINRVQAGCQAIADSFEGATIDGKGLALSAYQSQLSAFMDSISVAFTAGPDDPGYVVDAGPGVNTPQQIANGVITANVGFRAAGTAEWFFLKITATDAAGAL